MPHRPRGIGQAESVKAKCVALPRARTRDEIEADTGENALGLERLNTPLWLFCFSRARADRIQKIGDIFLSKIDDACAPPSRPVSALRRDGL